MDKTKCPIAYSIFTRSLTMIATVDIAIPPPNPNSALPKIKLWILVARAHHTVATVNTSMPPINNGFLPSASLRRPAKGCVAVMVTIGAVESHEAR